MAKLKLSNNSVEGCARALRAIGRNIASHVPQNLEIELIGETYKVHYRVRAETARVSKDAKAGVLQKLLSKSTQESTPTTLVSEIRTFAQRDLDRSDALEIPLRKSRSGNPDLFELGEQLRTVGSVVDLRQGQLIRLSKKDQSISFQYSDSSGQIHIEELTNQDLFRLQQEYKSKRQNQESDAWDHNAR